MAEKAYPGERKRRSLWVFLLMEVIVLVGVWQFRNRDPGAAEEVLTVQDVELAPQLVEIESNESGAAAGLPVSGEDIDHERVDGGGGE